MKKRKRLKDFVSRAEADPDWVYTLDGLGRYVAVNPMSDETELLSRIGWEASACLKVDLYWEYNDDVWFVQIQGEAYAVEQRPGVYARVAPSGYVNIVVVVPERVISSTVVAHALREVANRNVRIDRLQDRLEPLWAKRNSSSSGG